MNHWTPSWTENELDAAGAQVANLLRSGVYSEVISRANRQGASKSWLERQFITTARGAHATLSHTEKIIAAHANDTPRVLRLLRDEWPRYEGLVASRHGKVALDQIIAAGNKGPAHLYVHLVTVHVQRPWRNLRPGYEASAFSAWSKIGSDNQFLWPLDAFEDVFLVRKYF